jgi:WD40 repeat protein
LSSYGFRGPFHSCFVETVNRLWDLADGRELLRFPDHSVAVFCVACSAKGLHALSAGGKDQSARLWEAAGGAELECLEGHRGRVMSVAFAPDGRSLVTGGSDRIALLWQLDG